MEGTVQKDVRSQSSEEAGVGGESEGTSCCLIISLSPSCYHLPPSPHLSYLAPHSTIWTLGTVLSVGGRNACDSTIGFGYLKLMHVTVVTLTLILAYVAFKIIMVILIPCFFVFVFVLLFFLVFFLQGTWYNEAINSSQFWFISLINTYIFLFSENKYIYFFQATVAFPGIPIFVVLLVLDANIDKLVFTSDASITQNKV